MRARRPDDLGDPMAASARSTPTAWFTMRGSRLEVVGELDAGASVGFWAVAQSYVGDREVIIDLTRCHVIDSAGRVAVEGVERQIRHAGGTVAVLEPTGARTEPDPSVRRLRRPFLEVARDDRYVVRASPSGAKC